MIGPVVTGRPVLSEVLLVGQAPGPREGEFGKPFAWTAGKTLFRWLQSIGIEEDDFRHRAYMAAVCRCFPGKNPKGGDRVPNPIEITACGRWLDREIALLEPRLILPVGKLAISQFLEFDGLGSVVGQTFSVKRAGVTADLIPLPHPSGASTWHRMEPGKTLLQHALRLIAAHPAWGAINR
jgi:uracil-DNA glycosylase